MRAQTMDTRLEAIAGPVVGDWRDPEFSTPIPETGNHPVSVAVVVTPGLDGGGAYVFNSPTDSSGRRAYCWFFIDNPPNRMGGGLPSIGSHEIEVGVPKVHIFTLGNGIPASTRIRRDALTDVTGSRGKIHRVTVWPRQLTESEQLRVRQNLSIGLKLKTPFTQLFPNAGYFSATEWIAGTYISGVTPITPGTYRITRQIIPEQYDRFWITASADYPATGVAPLSRVVTPGALSSVITVPPGARWLHIFFTLSQSPYPIVQPVMVERIG